MKPASILKYIILLAITAVLLWLAFQGVDINATLAEMKNVKWQWLLLSVAVSLIAFFSRTYRWRMLMEPLGYKPPLDTTSAALMLGYLANLAMPRLGEVSRCGSLTRTDKIPFDKLLGTVIIERLVDVICLITCIVMTAWLEADRLGDFFRINLIEPLTAKTNSLANSPLLYILIIILLLIAFFLYYNRNHHVVGKVLAALKGVLKGFSSIRNVKSPFVFIFHSVLIWVMYFLMSYTFFFALDSTSGLGWHAGLFILVAGGMGMSAPVQGGIGAYHLLVSQGLLLYGVGKMHGLAYATLMHASQTLVVIILGAIAFLYLAFKRKSDDTSGSNKKENFQSI